LDDNIEKVREIMILYNSGLQFVELFWRQKWHRYCFHRTIFHVSKRQANHLRKKYKDNNLLYRAV
jgi:hypothetical protein